MKSSTNAAEVFCTMPNAVEVVELRFVAVRDVQDCQVCLNVSQIASIVESPENGNYHIRLIGQEQATVVLDPDEGHRLVKLIRSPVIVGE